MKTADLARSKRLKELGWEQESYFSWYNPCYIDGRIRNDKWLVGESSRPSENMIPSPTAGEMIEWLLGEEWRLYISFNHIEITSKAVLETKFFEITDGNICNALADACAWVKESQEVK